MNKINKNSIVGKTIISFNGAIKSIRDRLNEVKDEEKKFREAVHRLPKDTSNKTSKVVVDISPLSTIKTAALVFLLLFLFNFFYEIGYILLLFFVAFLFAAAFDPLVDKLQQYKIPRALTVIVIYIALFAFLALFVTNVVTLVADQIGQIAQSVGQFVVNFEQQGISNIPFADQLGPYIQDFLRSIDFQTAAGQLKDILGIISDQLLTISIGLANLIIILVLAFFMTVEEKSIESFYLSLFPSRYGEYISLKMAAVRDQIGLWLRGQLMVSIWAGVISYIGLVIMGVEYALTLALIAGILMVVPVVGRVFAWIITFPIVFNQDPMLSVWISLYYLIVQQVENNVMVPLIMNKAVGLSPIVIIFAMMVGFEFWNLPGLVISIPIATTAAIFIKDYARKEK